MNISNPASLFSKRSNTKPLLLILLVIILVSISLFFRTYKAVDWYEYSHDSDLSAWIFKNMVIDGNPRLIGQLTSVPGIFIGPLFYYLLVPLYLVGNLNPLPTLAYSWVIGSITTFSFFYVLSKLYSTRVGLIGALLHGSSFLIFMTEREVVPTTPVFLWSIWFYYSCHRLFSKKTDVLFLLAILFALTWHIQLNLSLLVLIPIIIFFINFKKIDLKKVFISAILFLFLSAPFIVFEIRNNFVQINSLLNPNRNSAITRTTSDKFIHVVSYVNKNINSIFWDKPASVNNWLVTTLVVLALAYLVFIRALKTKDVFVMVIWASISIGIFILHPINLSEYYLNNLNVLVLIVSATFLATIYKKLPLLSMLLIAVFIFTNTNRLQAHESNSTGYKSKTSLINFILKDSQSRGYKCVSYSFITHAGYDLGYRYLSWIYGLKLAPISNEIPVYTIVFPHNLVNRLDISFGSLGLVYPDYQKFQPETANARCPETDYNLSSSMFGFVN